MPHGHAHEADRLRRRRMCKPLCGSELGGQLRGSAFPAIAAVVATLAICACRPRPVAIISHCVPGWDTMPQLPLIRLREPTTPGTVTVLLLDRHKGLPLGSARISIQGAKLAALTDSSGRASLANVPAGFHVVEAIAVGYDWQRDTVTVGPAAGWALVMQLVRSASCM